MATAAVTKFLAAHPAFANMNHAEREKYRASHPAFNSQWIAANGFTGTWGNTAPAAAKPPASQAAAAPPGSPAAAAAAAETPVQPTPLTALPYDATADDMEAGAQSNFNDLLAQYTNAENTANTDYTKASRDLNESKDPIYRRLLNSYGGRGMARSTGYGSARGLQDNAFANAQNDLDTNKANVFASTTAGRTNAKSALDLILANASKRRAQTAAGRFMV